MKSKSNEYQNKFITMSKHTITVIITILISISSFAQQGINYKAILKDTNGNVIADTTILLNFIITQIPEPGVTGTIVYHEIHTYTTNADGLVILNIGEGDPATSEIFTDIDWSIGQHFLQTLISYDGNEIVFEPTPFQAVPYAKYAETAGNVNGLEAIDEGNGIGWRLKGRNTDYHDTLGENAIDLSYSPFTSSPRGATGSNSIVMGRRTLASGDYSTAIGNGASASGTNSVAMGHLTTAPGDNEVAIGVYNTLYDPVTLPSSNSVNPNRIFVIGNGRPTLAGPNARSDAFIVRGTGTIEAPSFSISEINTLGDKALITKEYADDSYLNSSSNLIPIAYGTIESNGNVLSGTDNFTASLNADVLIISVNNESISVNGNSCLITPYSTAFRTSSIIMSGGDIDVRIFDSSGNLNPTTFQFVIYKL